MLLNILPCTGWHYNENYLAPNVISAKSGKAGPKITDVHITTVKYYKWAHIPITFLPPKSRIERKL